MNDVETEVKTLLADFFDVDVSEIGANTNLANDLGADSLDLVKLGMVLEDKFKLQGLEFDTEFDDVSSIVKFVEENKGLCG